MNTIILTMALSTAGLVLVHAAGKYSYRKINANSENYIRKLYQEWIASMGTLNCPDKDIEIQKAYGNAIRDSQDALAIIATFNAVYLIWGTTWI